MAERGTVTLLSRDDERRAFTLSCEVAGRTKDVVAYIGRTGTIGSVGSGDAHSDAAHRWLRSHPELIQSMQALHRPTT